MMYLFQKGIVAASRKALLVLSLAVPTLCHAQLHIGPASTLYVAAGSTLQVDSLTLQPTATLALSANSIEKSATPQWTPGPTNVSIRQVYTMDTPIIFQGTASITYANANLNGNTGAMLSIVKAPEVLDSFQYASPSVASPSAQTVSTVFTTAHRLGKLSATNSGVPLPVNLLSFDAWPDGKRAKLLWKVAAEKEVSDYMIERSADGSWFYPLMKVAAKGSDEYLLFDEAPLLPNNYYRLAAKDHSGRLSYYGVRKVVFNGRSEGVQISAWPIPAGQELNLSFSAPAGGMLLLYDAVGKQVLGMPVSGQRMSIPLGDIAAGSYLLLWKDGERRQTLHIERH